MLLLNVAEDGNFSLVEDLREYDWVRHDGVFGIEKIRVVDFRDEEAGRKFSEQTRKSCDCLMPVQSGETMVTFRGVGAFAEAPQKAKRLWKDLQTVDIRLIADRVDSGASISGARGQSSWKASRPKNVRQHPSSIAPCSAPRTNGIIFALSEGRRRARRRS